MFVNKAIVVDVLITGKNQPKRQIRWLVSFLSSQICCDEILFIILTILTFF